MKADRAKKAWQAKLGLRGAPGLPGGSTRFFKTVDRGLSTADWCQSCSRSTSNSSSSPPRTLALNEMGLQQFSQSIVNSWVPERGSRGEKLG